MSDSSRLVTVITTDGASTYYRYSSVATPETPDDWDICENCGGKADWVTSGYEDPEFTTLAHGESGLAYCSACLAEAAAASYPGFSSYYV